MASVNTVIFTKDNLHQLTYIFRTLTENTKFIFCNKKYDSIQSKEELSALKCEENANVIINKNGLNTIAVVVNENVVCRYFEGTQFNIIWNQYGILSIECVNVINGKMFYETFVGLDIMRNEIGTYIKTSKRYFDYSNFINTDINEIMRTEPRFSDEEYFVQEKDVVESSEPENDNDIMRGIRSIDEIVDDSDVNLQMKQSDIQQQNAGKYKFTPQPFAKRY